MNEFSEEVAVRRDVVRPDDHKAMFSGNSDDHFRVGIRVTQGSVRVHLRITLHCSAFAGTHNALARLLFYRSQGCMLCWES